MCTLGSGKLAVTATYSKYNQILLQSLFLFLRFKIYIGSHRSSVYSRSHLQETLFAWDVQKP